MSEMPKNCSVFSRGSEQWLKCHDAVIECSLLNHAEKPCSEEVLSCIYEDAGKTVSPSKSCFNKFTGIAKEWAGEHKPLIQFTTSLDAPVISSNKTISEEVVVVPAIRNKRTGEIIIKDDHVRNPQAKSAYENGKLPLMGFVNATPQMFVEGLEGTAQLSRFVNIAANAGPFLMIGAAMNLTDLQGSGRLGLLQQNPDDIEIFPLYVKRTTLSKTEPYVLEKEWKSFWNRRTNQIGHHQTADEALPTAAVAPASVATPVVTTDEEDAAGVTQAFGLSEATAEPSECDREKIEPRTKYTIIGDVFDMLRGRASKTETSVVASSEHATSLGIGYLLSGKEVVDYLEVPGVIGYVSREKVDEAKKSGTTITPQIRVSYGMKADLQLGGPSKTIKGEELKGKRLTDILDKLTCDKNPVAIVTFEGVVRGGFDTTFWKKTPDIDEPFFSNEDKYVERENKHRFFHLRYGNRCR